MKLTYDAVADAAYCCLVTRELLPGEAVSQSDILPLPSGGSVILDFDRDGRLPGVEVPQARASLPQEALQQSVRIDACS